MLQCLLDRHTVDNSSEHPHIVTRRSFDNPVCCCGNTTDNIAAADHNTDFDAIVYQFFDLACNIVQDLCIDPVSFTAGKRFTGKFHQYSFYHEYTPLYDFAIISKAWLEGG